MALTTDQKVDKLVEFLTEIYGDNILEDKPDQPKPPVLKPAEGTYVVKEGGWGAIANPNTWKIVNMRDYPELFKIVDAPGRTLPPISQRKQSPNSTLTITKVRGNRMMTPRETSLVLKRNQRNHHNLSQTVMVRTK